MRSFCILYRIAAEGKLSVNPSLGRLPEIEGHRSPLSGRGAKSSRAGPEFTLGLPGRGMVEKTGRRFDGTRPADYTILIYYTIPPAGKKVQRDFPRSAGQEGREETVATILLVDDDASMRLLTTARLKHQFTVIPARDGVEALEVLARQPADLIIADVMMPRMDGYTLVKTLRERGNQIPVLLLTAKQSFEDKREGFSSGIDDYMTKPVNYEELVWRLNALLRRSRIASERRIVVGPVVLDSSTYTVTREGEALELPKKEFELLYRLLSYPGQIFTRNQLLDGIWGYASESGEDTVKTHISRLRNKLRHIPEFRIVTIKGLGYKAEITKGETP